MPCILNRYFDGIMKRVHEKDNNTQHHPVYSFFAFRGNFFGIRINQYRNNAANMLKTT